MSILDDEIKGVSVTSEVDIDISTMTPVGINVPDIITSMMPVTISWVKSEHDTNGIIKYKLERKLDNEFYCEIYCGTETSYSDIITSNWQTVQYRVCAVDPDSDEECSDYAGSAVVNINNGVGTTEAGNLGVGDIVKVVEKGEITDYLIIHKGIPSELYDESCDGIWLLRKNYVFGTVQTMGFSQTIEKVSTGNDYENSRLNTWSNDTFLNSCLSDYANIIKTVKIPFTKGKTTDGLGVKYRDEGLSVKIFALSGCELGYTQSDTPYLLTEGSKLDYFLKGANLEAAKRRRWYSGSTVMKWWVRSPSAVNSRSDCVYYVYCGSNIVGLSNLSVEAGNSSLYFRPAFILPLSTLVGSDGLILLDPPHNITIEADVSDNMGELSEGFVINCVITGEEGDLLSANASLNGKKFVLAYEDEQCKFAIECTGDDWLKIPLGEHTIDICASNGTTETHKIITFTRILDKVFIMPKNPIDIGGIIRACSLKIEGSLPEDADLVCEVTNNAKDIEPVWEDCTDRVKANMAYVFQNKESENGFAFNFKVSLMRGESGDGGYITKISGGFE